MRHVVDFQQARQFTVYAYSAWVAFSEQQLLSFSQAASSLNFTERQPTYIPLRLPEVPIFHGHPLWEKVVQNLT